MDYYHENTVLYHNGAYLKASEARMDLYSQSLHYGYGVFEGIRAYYTVHGVTKIFKANEHFLRLKQSAEALNMDFPYTLEELIEATYQVIARNNLRNAYIRPLIYQPANMSFTKNAESQIVIEVWEMAPFLGEKLVRVMVSGYQRPNPKAFKIEAKATGHYVNSILASQEAKAAGYDEALLTDLDGNAAEGPGANFFFEKDGRLFTPSMGHILPGITRATVLEICARLGILASEKTCSLDEVRKADAAFFCGTAAEVIGWESLDGVSFSKPWSHTLGKQVQDAYKNLVIEHGPQEPREPDKGRSTLRQDFALAE